MAPDPVRLFSGLEFSSDKPVIVAVSGGSDSLALLHLLRDYARDRPWLAIEAVTVDHGLRPEAAEEAAAVAVHCRAIGVRHRIVAWEGEKPRSGIIAAARDARYRLLADAAKTAGSCLILTGHTMDDQAETVAMRAARGEGAGLAGMAAATLYDDAVWIARPLLGMRRAALRSWLAGRGVGWVDDPSNANLVFERVRTRARLADAEIEALAARAREAGAARNAVARRAGDLLARHCRRPCPGLFALGEALARDVAAGRDPAAVLAARVILAVAGGRTHLPEPDRVIALFARLSGAGPARATLSRAVVDSRAGAAWIRREARGVSECALAGHRMLWDGRWRITLREPLPHLRIVPFGAPSANDMPAAGEGIPKSVARAALALEPALFDGARRLGPLSQAHSMVPGLTAAPVIAPFAKFLPAFDLPLDRAARRLLGLLGPLKSPWKQHIEAEA